MSANWTWKALWKREVNWPNQRGDQTKAKIKTHLSILIWATRRRSRSTISIRLRQIRIFKKTHRHHPQITTMNKSLVIIMMTSTYLSNNSRSPSLKNKYCFPKLNPLKLKGLLRRGSIQSQPKSNSHKVRPHNHNRAP